MHELEVLRHAEALVEGLRAVGPHLATVTVDETVRHLVRGRGRGRVGGVA